MVELAPDSLPSMLLQRLYPRPAETTPEKLMSRLDLGSRAPADRPYVVLNMVSSLDGKAAVEGSTRAMGGEVDRLLFHHMRTQADAIMVGATTAMTERYGRATKSDELRAKREEEGLCPQPLMVLVSGRLSVTADMPLLQAPEARVVVATAAERDIEGAAAQVSYVRTGDDLPLLLGLLRSDFGVRSVLCEGGPTLNGYLLAAGLVDELMLSVTATVVGGKRSPTIVGGRELGAPVPAELVSLHEAGGELFSRWRVSEAAGSAGCARLPSR